MKDFFKLSLIMQVWSYYEYLGLITLLQLIYLFFFSTFDQQIAMISFAQDSFLEVLHSG